MNKKEREIKEMLNSYYVPDYDKDAPMKAIQFIHENSSSIKNLRATNKEFILSQIGFIRKRTWVFQIIVLALICLAFCNIESEHALTFESFSLISIFSPILLIINIEEISRVYYKSMLEIEFSTKNSLKKVLATRMLILGIADCIVLTIMMIFAGKSMNISILRVIMYTFVPFNLVCIGCMELMKYFKGRELNYASIIYSALLMATLLLGRLNNLQIYAQNFISSWIFIYIITTIVFAIEIKKFWKRLDLFDDVIKGVII
ncbi:hypothetical protein [Clostridium oceanicum]|uniref:Membrane protein n=1 Tax=Clostridium oceanicum TaxID=1543 RepID=A0ABN1JKE5_9CLOT